MRSQLEQITPRQLEEFLEEPQKAYEHVLCEVIENVASAELAQKMIQELLSTVESQGFPPEFKSQVQRVAAQTTARIEKYSRTKSTQVEEQETRQPRKTFSLEKDWHVVHYALNGTAGGGEGALADAVLGGKEIPDVEGVMGYGPLRYLEPERVQSVAHALAAVDPAQLLSRLDHRDAEAKGIYLAHTLSNPADWSYFPKLFEDFRAFYDEAAYHGNAMLLSIT
jgi:hypothetical protein